MPSFTKSYNGQTKQEFNKNYSRIHAIVSKACGDKQKENSLASIQAKLIKDEKKAINRAKAAKELNHENIFEIFLLFKLLKYNDKF